LQHNKTAADETLPPHPPAVRDALLRRTFELARAAVRAGEAPFGALLADADGTVLLEHANAVEASRDATDHAEAGLVRRASGRLPAEAVARSYMYASSEPCGMCSCAIFWVGIPRLTYGCPASHIGELAACPGFRDREHPLAGGAPCIAADAVLVGPNALGIQRVVEGGLLLDEAKAVHVGYWVQEAAAAAMVGQ
jgi:tRNA(Arg) A34 adenosine deaminase TadA